MTTIDQGESERDDLIEKEKVHNVNKFQYTIRAISWFISALARNRWNSKPFQIKAKILRQIVEEKNNILLQKYGGVDGIAKALETCTENGLNCDHKNDIARRRKFMGTNKTSEPKSFFKALQMELSKLSTIILFLFGVVSIVLGTIEDKSKGWTSGVSLLIGVFAAVIFTFASKYWHNRLLLKSMLKSCESVSLIYVMRARRRRWVPTQDIVVGDVVYIKIGDRVPCYGLILESRSLKLDIDGESDTKKNREPFLSPGTKVVYGSARMLVTSFSGHLKLSQLKKLSTVMVLSVITSVVLFLLSYSIAIIGNVTEMEDKHSSVAIVTHIFEVLLAFITIFIDIPDPWELSAIFSRTYAMKKIVTHGDTVKLIRSSSLETLCSVTTICTNKTGVITSNQMNVTHFWLPEKYFIHELGHNISSELCFVKLLRDGIVLNTGGHIQSDFGMSNSLTEKAILSWACNNLKANIKEVKGSHEIIGTCTFNSHRKGSGIRAKKKIDGTIHVHWKGAPEVILAMCSTYYNSDGSVQDLNEIERKEFKRSIEGMSATGLRCIGFAYKKVLAEEEGVVDMGLSMLGVAGITNPCRSEVRSAIVDFCASGGYIKMVTGDNVFTAKKIATDCGILSSEVTKAVIEGHEFHEFQGDIPEKKFNLVDNMCVMARASPEHKQNVLECLKRKDRTIAFVGSNTISTASAMVRADVGILVGSNEDNMEVADIVVSDGNFTTILKLVEWRRCVYSNILKFSQLCYTAKASSLLASSIGSFFMNDLPMTTVQLMWLNIVTDALGAMAFSTGEASGNELSKMAPQLGTELSITNVMMRNIIPQVLYQTGVLLTLFFKGESIFGVNEKVNNTLLFNSYILCQVFNEINSRQLANKNVFGKMKKMFLSVIAVTVVFQFLIVEIMSNFAGTERLSLLQWVYCVGIAALTLPIGLIARLIPLPETEVFDVMKKLINYAKGKFWRMIRRMIPKKRASEE